MKKWLTLLLFIITLTACNNHQTTEQLIAEEQLKANPNANIIMINGNVYRAVNPIDKGNIKLIENEVGVIEKNYSIGNRFKNGMATTLAIGTKIYKSSNNSILIADVNNNFVYYEIIPEG